MKLYEYNPQKNVKKLGLVTGLLLMGAGILILIEKLIPNLSTPWAFQLLAVGMLMISIFVTSRYIMKSYVYAIIDDDGSVDLTVTEIQGRHVITVCRISLFSIEKIYVCDSKLSEREIKAEIKREKRALI